MQTFTSDGEQTPPGPQSPSVRQPAGTHSFLYHPLGETTAARPLAQLRVASVDEHRANDRAGRVRVAAACRMRELSSGSPGFLRERRGRGSVGRCCGGRPGWRRRSYGGRCRTRSESRRRRVRRGRHVHDVRRRPLSRRAHAVAAVDRRSGRMRPDHAGRLVELLRSMSPRHGELLSLSRRWSEWDHLPVPQHDCSLERKPFTSGV